MRIRPCFAQQPRPLPLSQDEAMASLGLVVFILGLLLLRGGGGRKSRGQARSTGLTQVSRAKSQGAGVTALCGRCFFTLDIVQLLRARA